MRPATIAATLIPAMAARASGNHPTRRTSPAARRASAVACRASAISRRRVSASAAWVMATLRSGRADRVAGQVGSPWRLLIVQSLADRIRDPTGTTGAAALRGPFDAGQQRSIEPVHSWLPGDSKVSAGQRHVGRPNRRRGFSPASLVAACVRAEIGTSNSGKNSSLPRRPATDQQMRMGFWAQTLGIFGSVYNQQRSRNLARRGDHHGDLASAAAYISCDDKPRKRLDEGKAGATLPKTPDFGKVAGPPSRKAAAGGPLSDVGQASFSGKLVGMACSAAHNRGGEPEPD